MAEKSDFGKFLFSPPVIIGGVAIGALLLLMNSGSANAGSGGTAGPSAAQLGAVVQMNQIAANNQQATAQIAAQSGAATLGANVLEQGQILSFLSNLANTNATVTNNIVSSQAGVTNATIASNTAVALDVNNNMERLNQAYVESDTAQAVAMDQLQATQAQAKAAQNIALTNGITGIISGITKVAAAPFTGGASLLSGIGTSSFGGGTASLPAAPQVSTNPYTYG